MKLPEFRSNDIWDTQAARSYDTQNTVMFSPEILIPTVNKLFELAEGGQTLEFAIGTGRVALPLSNRDVSVKGIELSPAMLSQLRTKADETVIPVVQGNMATVLVQGEFTLVYLVYNTISNLLTQAEQVSCFGNAARHLVPGGRFVVELGVPELQRLLPGQNSVLWRSDPDYIGIDYYDVLHQRLVSHHIKLGEGRQAEIFRSPHRYIWPSELDLMADLAGFELENRSSDWIGSPFTSESPSHVSVYRLK